MNFKKTQIADERAFMYDDHELGIVATDKNNTHWERWKERYLKCIELSGQKNGDWLDVACGSGYGTEIISEYVDKVIGIDLDFNAIVYANKHHKSSNNITFEQQDISSLSFSNNQKFDSIISIETIEHIKDANPFLKNIIKFLKDDGVFVVTTPESNVGGGPNPNNKFHLNEYTRDQLALLLNMYFNNVEISNDTAIFSTGIETTQLYARCFN